MIDIDYLKSIPVLDVVEVDSLDADEGELFRVEFPLGWVLQVFETRVLLHHGGELMGRPCADCNTDLESLDWDAWDGEVEDPDADTFRRMWKDLWDMRGDLEELAERHRQKVIGTLDWDDLVW